MKAGELPSGGNFPRFFRCNMKQLMLSNRLAAVTGMLGGASGVIDVGTDHGYLPVWLALNGAARRLVAADVRSGPLRRARETAQAYGVSDRIEFILTDGFDGIGADGIDAVVLAGMGGETITGILDKAPWVLDRSVRLILQPQTKADVLIGWLKGKGCRLWDAALAEDDGRLYLVFAAGAGEDGPFRGPLGLLLMKRDPLLPRYLSGLIEKFGRALHGLERSSRGRLEEIEALRAEIDGYIRMKEEVDRW